MDTMPPEEANTQQVDATTTTEPTTLPHPMEGVEQEQVEPSVGQQQQQQSTAANAASTTTTTTATATNTTTSQPLFVFSVNGSSELTRRNNNDLSATATPFVSSSSFVFRVPVPITTTTSPVVPTTTTTMSGTGQGGIDFSNFATPTPTSSAAQAPRRIRCTGHRRSGGRGRGGGRSAAGIRAISIGGGGGGGTQSHQNPQSVFGRPVEIRSSIGNGPIGTGGGIAGTQNNQNPPPPPHNNNTVGVAGRGVGQQGVYFPGATNNNGGGGGDGAHQRVTFAPGVGGGGGSGDGGRGSGGVGGVGGRQMSLQFRVPSGSRVHVHRSGGGALGFSMNNHGAMGMGMGMTSMGEVRIPPLQPLVMMDSLQNIHDNNADNENGSYSNNSNSNDGSHRDLERFKCTLCCEFMRYAHACGADQCESRFCSDCVDKLVAAAPLSNNNNNNNKLCPTCRNVVQGDFVRDESLLAEDIPPIPCRFQGCQDRLKLEHVAAHEAICPMVRMSCKYKSFGCSWTGLRGELSRHEEHDCPLAKIRFLVEQHRGIHATQQHHFGHLNARTQMAMQLAESHNQRIVQLERSTQAATATAASNNGVSTSNPMDVLSFVFAILVSLPNFYKLEFQWRAFLTVDGRAAVFNTTMMLAPTIVFGKLLFEFYARALHILGGTCPNTGDCGLFSGAMSLVSCILIGSLFLQDNISTQAWNVGALPTLSQFAWLATHLSATVFGLKFFGMFRGLILLWWTLVSTVFFPILLTGVSIKHARMGMPRPQDTEPFMSNLCDTGRAFYPLVFGFRTALPCVMFGPTTAVTALLLVDAIQPLFSHVLIGFAMKPCFPGSSSNYVVGRIFFLIGGALRLGRQEFLNFIMGALFSFVTVIATNLFIWSLSRFGMRLANKLIDWDPVRPPPGTLPVGKDSSVGGSLVVVTWVAVLVFIAAT